MPEPFAWTHCVDEVSLYRIDRIPLSLSHQSELSGAPVGAVSEISTDAPPPEAVSVHFTPSQVKAPYFWPTVSGGPGKLSVISAPPGLRCAPAAAARQRAAKRRLR